MTELIDRAKQHARRMGHNYIGTEMILLALPEHRISIAANALSAAGIRPRHLRPQIEELIGHGSGPVAWEVPFTPRAKRVLELSWSIARECGDNFIESEHLLLALLKEGDGCAMQALTNLHADVDLLQQDIHRRIAFRQNHQAERQAVFKSDSDKQKCLQQLQEQIRAWQSRAWMAKQQNNEDLVRQALEQKWKYERKYAEAKNIEPPEEPEDPTDLPDPDEPGSGPPPEPSGVPRKPKPKIGDSEDALPLPPAEETEASHE